MLACSDLVFDRDCHSEFGTKRGQDDSNSSIKGFPNNSFPGNKTPYVTPYVYSISLYIDAFPQKPEMRSIPIIIKKGVKNEDSKKIQNLLPVL